jgi:hypothetical protein
MDIIRASKIVDNGLLSVNTGYKIVSKKETKVLLKILFECKSITNAFNVMSFTGQDELIDEAIMIEMLNSQILKKLKKLYRYYSRYYGIRFDGEDFGEDLIDEFGFDGLRQKNILNNIAKICEEVRSWE